jgi:hypothetical protein
MQTEPELNEDRLIDVCRQCHREVWVRADEDRPDGPFVCDACVRETVNRAARSPLSNYIWDTAVLNARLRRVG